LIGLLIEAEGEHLVLPAKVQREKAVDEGQIVMHAADLKDFLPPQASASVPGVAFCEVVAVVVLLAEAPAVPAVFDVAEQFQPQLVRV
jgi:hypothetical protein